jgi:hypothetical protein
MKWETILASAFALLFVGLTVLTLAPLGIIWALNELFLFNIEYSFRNWLAMFVLFAIFKTSITNKS